MEENLGVRPHLSVPRFNFPARPSSEGDDGARTGMTAQTLDLDRSRRQRKKEKVRKSKRERERETNASAQRAYHYWKQRTR